MSDDVFVPYDKLPKPHTGSFLTAKEIESFKDAFKDIVRVVRCKDCRYAEDCVSPYKEGEKWCMKMDAWTPKEWFCADGERRTNDA